MLLFIKKKKWLRWNQKKISIPGLRNTDSKYYIPCIMWTTIWMTHSLTFQMWNLTNCFTSFLMSYRIKHRFLTLKTPLDGKNQDSFLFTIKSAVSWEGPLICIYRNLISVKDHPVKFPLYVKRMELDWEWQSLWYMTNQIFVSVFMVILND